MELKEDGRTFKMAQIEVKRSPDGRPLARRTDGKPLTAQDREEARRLSDSLLSDDTPGVTAADVLRVFGGGLVIQEDKPISCRHCDKEIGVPNWRKGGKIVQRTRADGVYVWACHFCGREAKRARGSVVTIH